MFHVLTLALTLAQTGPAPVPAGPHSTSRSIATMVNGIVSFARWPVQPNPMRICLIGRTRMADADLDAALRGARITRLPDPTASIPGGCDMLYFGAVPAPRLSALLSRGHDRPLLTIAEEDASCRGGAMFCLHVRRHDVVFELNLDAVSRSGVTVDPRVLRLSSGQAR